MTDEMAVEKPRHGLFVPLVLIGVGIVFFFTTLGLLEQSAWDIFMKWWPALMIIAGIDQLWQRSGSVGAILVIGLGGLFLLGNLGVLGVSAWNVILRMWPVFVIAWGLDLLVGNRNNFSIILGVVLGFILFLAVIWLTFYAPFSTQKATGWPVNYEANGVTTLNANVDSVYGELTVGAHADPAMLVSGHIQAAENQQIKDQMSVEGSAGTLNIDSAGNIVYPIMPFGPSQTLSWDLGFNPNTVLDLKTRTVLGKQTLDLSLLRVQGLQAETVMGRTQIALPAAANFSADINTVIGELEIIVPPGAAVEVTTNTFFTQVVVPDDFVKTEGGYQSPAFAGAPEVMRLVIDQPIGRLVIRYAE